MSRTQEKRNSILKDLKNLLIWISIALIIRWQVIEPRWIPSGSMLPTLQIQDKILVEKVTPKITSKSNLSKLKNKIVVFNVERFDLDMILGVTFSTRILSCI